MNKIKYLKIKNNIKIQAKVMKAKKKLNISN